MSTLPMMGNLGWAPAPGIENVDIFDRFNGVPTLGLFSEWHLPADAGADRLIDEMLEFLREALDIAMQQELPPVRRELIDLSGPMIDLATTRRSRPSCH